MRTTTTAKAASDLVPSVVKKLKPTNVADSARMVAPKNQPAQSSTNDEKLKTEKTENVQPAKPPQKTFALPVHSRKLPLRNDWQNRWLNLEVTHADIQRMANKVQNWVGTWFANPTGDEAKKHIVICGKSDTGKSHTANRVYSYLKHARFLALDKGKWSNPPTVEIFEFEAVCTLETEVFRSWLNDRMQTDVLFLEDVGSETDRFKSAEPTERLRLIFEMFRNRYLFITTNIFPEDFENKWDDRVANRMLRNSEVVELRDCAKWSLAKLEVEDRKPFEL